jgi:hypothetical protein
LGLVYIFLGVLGGVLGGLLGIGGGALVVPALVYLFGMTLHKAQGTMLAAFLPPVTVLAVWKYFQTGNVDIKAAVLVALGIFAGSFFGAWLNVSLSEVMVRRVFGIFLIVIAAKLLLGK